MKIKEKKQRLNWLDVVKGIGILFVVIGHVYIEDGIFSRIIHGLNVPLFFLASGYLSAYQREWEKGKKEILDKKIRSILRPYILFSAVVMVWLLVRFFIFHYGSIKEILHCLADIFCLEGISVLWFLSALFIGEIIFLFSEQGVAKQQKPSGKCLIILFVLFTFAAFFAVHFIEWAENILGGVLMKVILKASRIAARGVVAAVFMLLGAMIRQAEETLAEKEILTKRLWIMGIILCGIPAVVGLWYNGQRDFHYLSFGCFPLYLLNGFLGFLTISFIARLGFGRWILRFLGQNSLIIMGTHLIFLDFINIMAVILSAPAGRYLGDEWEAKLAVLILMEILLFSFRGNISWRSKRS